MPGIGIPAFAMVGMAAMVGGGTGAAMTAVTMIFEMTRDYDIVMPMIVAVAISIGVRRMLSRENIYTIKLVGRGHFIPKALHANMFLVRHAARRDGPRRHRAAGRDEFRRIPAAAGARRARCSHVVVTRGDRIVGVLRVNIALRRPASRAPSRRHARRRRAAATSPSRASDDIVFDVINRMWRHRRRRWRVVVSGNAAIPRADDVVGVITKEHIADSVAESVKTYGQ